MELDKNSFETAENIILAIRKKNKTLSTYNQKSLRKQALFFSPLYRDFIAKIISSSSLSIKLSHNDGYCSPSYSLDRSSTLNKRVKVEVNADIDALYTLPHELGHAVDFFFGYDKSLSSNVLLSSNMTLQEAFSLEFSSKKEEIYKEVMNEYKSIMDVSIGKNAFDIITSNIHLYRKLKTIPLYNRDITETKIRKELQNHLEEIGFVECYYRLFKSRCFDFLNLKYSPILDALSSVYDLSYLFLEGHGKDYYKNKEGLEVQEFFANLFLAKVASQYVQFDSLIKLLPKSFKAFEELFFLFYNRLMGKKTFLDINLTKKER